MTKTTLDQTHDVHLARRACSVSDLEYKVDDMELDINQLEQDLELLYSGLYATEVGMADLQESDYPAYCAVYETVYGCEPALRRQAD